MRTKRKNVCQECRSRKLACDGKSPACSQCTLRKVTCTGYRQEFLFVVSSETKKQAELIDRRKISSTYRQNMPADSDSNYQLIKACSSHSRLGHGVPLKAQNHRALEDDVCCILQHYTPINNCDPAESNPSHNQICGAWVEALPCLLTTRQNNAFLSSAIKAFATSLRCFNSTDTAYKMHALEMYCKSLSLTSEALKQTQGVFKIQHCVAIMCLAVSDIMLPNSNSGWTAHTKGVANWVESLGPEPFSNGVLRTLFVGFRPLLLISSILSRRMTFLEQEDWTTKPFCGQTPSMMQQLLSRASKVPGLLERFDAIKDSLKIASFVVVERLWRDFQDTMESLYDWELSQWSQNPSALSWARHSKRIVALSDAKDIWFLNLMVANSLTHCWAFMIIVKTHLSVLGTALDARGRANKRSILHPRERSLVSLAGMICDSMTYLLQPEMKLYGPGSAVFTITTAVKVFKSNADQYSARLLHCQQISAQLAAFGIRLPEV